MKPGAKRVLLFAGKTGYQVREFSSAAEELGVELVLATDRCHMLDDPWGDQAVAVDFAKPAEGIEALRALGPVDGVLAVGDGPAYVAAQAAAALGLRYHPPHAALAAKNKLLARHRFRAAGALAPAFRSTRLEANPNALARTTRYPCVLKALELAGSRGVIRADNPQQFIEAVERIQAIVKRAQTTPELLIEEFIPGREFALEGLLSNGALQPLAVFDKPDPLDGPFFEETIYVTPSRLPKVEQGAIRATVQRAATALGLRDGPVHAEVRVNAAGVWMLEAAARPIGGLCARALRFDVGSRSLGLEALLLRHAWGDDVSSAELAPGGHGVMMIPIPQEGIYQGVEGMEQARTVSGITDVVITAKEGQMIEPPPEGSSYLGFIFAHASTSGEAEAALREAFTRLKFLLSTALPVVR